MSAPRRLPACDVHPYSVSTSYKKGCRCMACRTWKSGGRAALAETERRPEKPVPRRRTQAELDALEREFDYAIRNDVEYAIRIARGAAQVAEEKRNRLG